MSKKLIAAVIIGMGFASVSFGQTPGARVSDMYTDTDYYNVVAAQGDSIDDLCKLQVAYNQATSNTGWSTLPPFTYTGYYWRVPGLQSGQKMLVQCRIAETQYTPSITLPLKCSSGSKIYQSQPTGCYK